MSVQVFAHLLIGLFVFLKDTAIPYLMTEIEAWTYIASELKDIDLSLKKFMEEKEEQEYL